MILKYTTNLLLFEYDVFKVTSTPAVPEKKSF
jgi:hypothetical protein